MNDGLHRNKDGDPCQDIGQGRNSSVSEKRFLGVLHGLD